MVDDQGRITLLFRLVTGLYDTSFVRDAREGLHDVEEVRPLAQADTLPGEVAPSYVEPTVRLLTKSLPTTS